MITQFQEAVATKPDGIAVMGHPGDDAFDPLIDDARSQGIIVTVMNTELPKAQAKYATAGLGYVGAVLHDAGAALANEAIARGGLKSGDRAFVWGLVAQAGRGERTQGILDALEEAGLTVDYLEIDDATNADPASGRPDLHRVRLGASGPQGDLHRPRQPDVDDPDLHEGGQPRSPAASTRPASTCRRRRCRASRTATSAWSSTSSSTCRASSAIQQLCLTSEVRVQRPVHQHRRRLHRQGQRRRDRAHSSSSRSGDVADLSERPTSTSRACRPSPRAAGGRRTGAVDRRPQRPDASSSAASPSRSAASTSSRDVDFRLAAGEVVGLLGDNGAGKSTLIKIITGVHQPDEGEILFGGERGRRTSTVQRARALGVETVFQERALAEQLPLWRNIFMGRPISGRLGFLKVGEMRRITAELMGESMGFTSAALTPDTSVIGLSGGERQGLAIVRALHFEADIIILDEPTMGLSLKETEKLLALRRRDPGRRQVGDLHRPQHLPRLLGRGPDRRPGPRPRGRRVPDRRYSLEELMGIMREVAVDRRLHGAGALPAGRGRRPASDRAGAGMSGAVTTTAASRRRSARRASPRVGVADRHHGRLPPALVAFVVLAPRTFLDQRIYLSFAQTTPYFAIIAMALTMVIVAGDIDLSFPSVMALGMVGFVFVWEATGSVGLGAVVGARVGAAGRPVQRPHRHVHRHPGAGRHDRHPVPLPRPRPGARRRARATALVETQGSITLRAAGRQACSASRWSSGGWSSRRSAPGCCSTAIASARTPTSIGDNRAGGRADGHPDPADADHAVRARRAGGGVRRPAEQPPVVNFYPSMGPGYLLPALAAVFVGGTSVFGGRGSIYGTFIGAFMIGGITAGHRRHRPDRLLRQPHLWRDHPHLGLDPRRPAATLPDLTTPGRPHPVCSPGHDGRPRSAGAGARVPRQRLTGCPLSGAGQPRFLRPGHLLLEPFRGQVKLLEMVGEAGAGPPRRRRRARSARRSSSAG